MTVKFRPKTSEIPTDAGVYRFFGSDDRVLYVGKAKNLRARLTNYFQKPEKLAERTRLMVQQAVRVDWTVVGTEIEALQLEFTWIKEYNPRYNVVFRDDKSYPYIAVTLADEAPRAIITRTAKIGGARYFGPYPKVWAVRETLAALQKAVGLRTCTDANYRRAMQTGKPCFASQIGKCAGPCSQNISVADYQNSVQTFLDLLSGKTKKLAAKLKADMFQAAAAQNYELAAKLRDRLQSLDLIAQRGVVVQDSTLNIDVLGIAVDELSMAAELFEVRAGRIRSAKSWTAALELDTALSIIVSRLLFEIYAKRDDIPNEILVPVLPDDSEDIEKWMSVRAGRKVRLHLAQRGPKAQLADTVTANAKEDLLRYKLKRSADYSMRSGALTEIQSFLGMAVPPLRIECYDISHLGGTGVVASMVVFEDGLPKPKEYRSFKIIDTTDDTASMKQVLSRRLARLDAPRQAESKATSFQYRPSLILVDGGLPQVNAAAQAIAEAGHSEIFLAGIAKRLEELWLPGEDFPVIMPRDSEGLYLLQRVRDEAHRFAIKHQRQSRKQTLTTKLVEIPGIGTEKAKLLLRKFGSVAKLKSASIAEITSVPGIADKLAQQIIDSLTKP